MRVPSVWDAELGAFEVEAQRIREGEVLEVANLEESICWQLHDYFAGILPREVTDLSDELVAALGSGEVKLVVMEEDGRCDLSERLTDLEEGGGDGALVAEIFGTEDPLLEEPVGEVVALARSFSVGVAN